MLQGKLQEADQTSRQALTMRRKLLGNEHPEVAASLDNLALILRKEKQLPEAEALARQVGIVCLPGEYFGEGQGEFLRFAFANADCARIAELPSRIAKLSL